MKHQQKRKYQWERCENTEIDYVWQYKDVACFVGFVFYHSTS